MDVVHVGTVVTPLGPFTVVGTDEAVLASGFTESTDRLLPLIHATLRPAGLDRGDACRPHLDAVERYFGGELGALDEVPVAYQGGDFTRRAWVQLRAVGAGQRISYGELARRSGNASAGRAAGQACARNPATLFIPCHRIVASTGHPNHFGWGLPLKRWLLAYEGGETGDRQTELPLAVERTA